MRKTPTTWIILDGLGLRRETEGNAAAAARTPVLDGLLRRYASTSLAASGADVGLAEGQRGSSASGRSNLEAGRVVLQPRTVIDRAIDDGTFFENPAYNRAMDDCLARGTALHLVGLVSDGGVHASLEHLFALLKLASIKGLARVYIHAVLDGWDVPDRTGRAFLDRTLRKCAALGVGRVATVMGRWYAMDRHGHWDRVAQAYDAMVYGEGLQFDDPILAVSESYHDGIPDEHTKPIVCDRDGMVADHDSVIFFNCRGDRTESLTRAFTDPEFTGFQREFFPVTFVRSAADAELPNTLTAFPSEPVRNGLGSYLRRAGMTVTQVETVRDAVDAILLGVFDLVTLCLNDCSAAGHTGDFDRAVRAVEYVDRCVGKAVEATLQMGGIAIVTAGHGNVEQMRDENGAPDPTNTANPVPFILCGAGKELRPGRLADVAPTILDVLGLEAPPEMTGKTLILR